MNGMALYDALNCASVAVDESGSGRTEMAEAAWLETRIAASRVTEPGTPLYAALSVITGAVELGLLRPSRDRAELWHALSAASLAALIAADGDLEAAAVPLLKASGHAARTSCAAAFRVILAAITDLAVTAEATA